MNEDEVAQLVEDAVDLARHTSPGNMSDEAVIQRIMKEEYVDGRWRSSLFRNEPLYVAADEID
jgi:histone H3/H4